MKSKSKNKQKRLFVLGSSGAIIAGSIAAGLTVGAGVPSTLPTGITTQNDYFTEDRNAAINRVITQIGLNQDSFLDPTENANFQLVKNLKQFSVVDSTVTIDDLLTRLNLLQSIGVFGFNNTTNNIERINLDADIRALQQMKDDATRDANDPAKVALAYQGIANIQREIFNELIPPVTNSSDATAVLKRNQNIRFSMIRALWNRNQTAFRNYAFDYINTWITQNKNNAIVNNPKLGITLAKVNTTTRSNVDYVSGSFYTHMNAETWNTERGARIFQDQTVNGQTINSYRFPGRGTVIFNNSSTMNKNVVFIKENLSPADFMLFQLLISGHFNEDAEAEKLTKASSTTNNNINIMVRPGNLMTEPVLSRPIDMFINNETQATINAFQAQYFNLELYNQLVGKTFQINNMGTTFMYNETLNDNTLPDQALYLASANQSAAENRAEVFRQYEQKARKYFIERFYAGIDGSMLNVNNIRGADTATRNRLNVTTRQTSLYLTNTNAAYSIVNKTNFISHLEQARAYSLSFKWFVTTHYNKDGMAVALNGDNRPEYAKIRDWKFNPSNGTAVITSTEGDTVFRNANDKMIYDYIEFVARTNNFNLDDPNANEIFKNLYRLIRSTITFENSWSAAQSDGGMASVVLNGYNQNSDKLDHSSILTITSSMVVKFYEQLVASIQSAITEATSTYAKNPSESQLTTLLNIYNFFQLYINPLQFSIDDPSSSPIDNKYLVGTMNIWQIFTRYLATNFPNFGATRLNGNNIVDSTDVLTGLSVTFARGNNNSQYLHTNLLNEYKTFAGITGNPTREQFEEFRNWFLNVKLRKDINVLVNRGTLANNSTNDLDKISILGTDYSIDPRYPLGRTLAAIQFTNAAVLSPQRGVVDQITNQEFKTANISRDRLIAIGLDGGLNFDNDITNANRPTLTTEYFNNKVRYNVYLTNSYTPRAATNSRLAPLAPISSSSLYNGNYSDYSTDYNSYIGKFYKSETTRTDIKFNLPLPTPPQIYVNTSTQNSDSYFRNFASYLDVLKKYNELERSKRNRALKRIQAIPLLTQEDTSYKVTLQDGTIITSPNGWLNEMSMPLVTTENPITKIEAGPRNVRINLEGAFIKWRNPSNRALGIEQILPGPNGITNDPENLSEKITTRNLLIRQLERTALQDYRNLYNQVNSWYLSVRSELRAEDIIRFNQEILGLNQTTGQLTTIDGYTITKQENLIDEDTKYPWDTATANSSDTNSESYFTKINAFITEVSAARSGTTNRIEKARELTLDLINKSLSTGVNVYNNAKTLLEEYLNGTKTVNTSGTIITATEASPLSMNFPESATIATQAIAAAEALRNYGTNSPNSSFNTYINALNGVTDTEYNQALSTVSLIFEHNKFNSHTFAYDSTSSTPKPILKNSWGFATLNLSGNQLTNLTAYNSAVDAQTMANTSFRFLNKFFSPADPDSAQFVTDRDSAIVAIQDLYSTIGTAGSAGAFAYQPTANAIQAQIDARNMGLSGDIANIFPNNRATLTTKYFEANLALERIRVQTANLVALRNTKDAINFIYENAKITTGGFDRVRLDSQTQYQGKHFFRLTVDRSAKTVNVSDTLNTTTNPAAVKVTSALQSIMALNDLPSVERFRQDYLSALAAITELVQIEERLITTPDKKYSLDLHNALDTRLILFTQQVDSGFTLKPKYTTVTDTTTEVNFLPIINPELRTLILRKIQYLQYLSAAYLIKDNYIPGFDLFNGEIDPTFHMEANGTWKRFLLQIKHLGHSTVSYRELSDANKLAIDQILERIYPVVRRPNDPDETGTNPVSRGSEHVNMFIPNLQTVNDIRTILTLMNNNSNNVTLLQTQYNTDMALKAGLMASGRPLTPAANLFNSVIDQTKNFLDIQNANNNNNSNFANVPAISDAPDNRLKTYNQFRNSAITDQLQKLRNAKTLHDLLIRIKTFRDQYTTIGIGGVMGQRPEDIRSEVPADIFNAWQIEENKVKALLENGTIPGFDRTLNQINSDLNGAVNLNPEPTSAADGSISLTPVSFRGNELITSFSTINTILTNLQTSLINATNALTNRVSSNQLTPLLNELNGNITTIMNGNNVYNTTPNPNNPNNAVYAVNPATWNSSSTAVPAIREMTNPGNTSLTAFNANFAPTKAFSESNRNMYNTFPYEDFLEIKTAEGKGPSSLRKAAQGTTTQAEINTVINYLNAQMTEQVMNAIYWANTDYLILSKMDEFLFQTTNSMYSLNDMTPLTQKRWTYPQAFEQTKMFFEAELMKSDSKYILVERFDPAADLQGKIPLLNFRTKMSGYSQLWKDLLVMHGNASEALRTDYRNKGFVLETLATLASAADTNSRASYISAYNEYIAARRALNGEVQQAGSSEGTLGGIFSRITSSIETDWLTRTYNRQNDITLQNVLKRAQIITEESSGNKFILATDLENTIAALNAAFIAKRDADTETRIQVVNRFPQLANAITDTLKDTSLSFGQKQARLITQIATLTDAIGVRKTNGTGVFDSAGNYVLATYENDPLNLSGVVQIFATLDPNLVQVARTYEKTLQFVDVITSYMKAIDDTQNDPNTSKSDLFAKFNTALTTANANGSMFKQAMMATPNLLTTMVVDATSTSEASTTNVAATADMTALNNLFASIETARTSLPTSAASVKGVVDKIVAAKNALDALVNDTSAVYETGNLITARQMLISTAKMRVDEMLSANSESIIATGAFNRYRDQLKKYWKALLTLEKVRNLFIVVLSKTDAPNMNIENTDLDFLYNQHMEYLAKRQELAMVDSTKTLYHMLKKELLDSTKRANFLTLTNTWLASLVTAINAITSDGNPNSIETSVLDKFRASEQKVATGYTFINNYIIYNDTNFVGDPATNINKVNVPNNVGFELDSGIRNYRKGSIAISEATFTNISNNIKQLVAFNGLFDVSGLAPNPKLGALSLLFKNPTLSEITKIRTLATQIKDTTLPSFTTTIAAIPAELSKAEDLTSWSLIKFLNDLKDEAMLNLAKFDLVTKLDDYLRLNTDAAKNALTMFLNGFTSTANQNLLKAILPTDHDTNAKLFNEKYLEGLKALVTKVAKIGDQFNLIDKVIIGQPNPKNMSEMVTRANQNTIRNQLLNETLMMVDGMDEATEISNLNTEVTDAAIRNFLISEFGFQAIKDETKLKISRKRFEVNISVLKNLAIESYSNQSAEFLAVSSGIADANQSNHLRIFANLVIAQKDLEAAYTAFVRNVGSIDRTALFALERRFLDIRNTFTNLDSQKTNWSASEQALYSEITTESNIILTESEVVTSLQRYTEVPNNTNKADLAAKITAANASAAKDLFTTFINPAMELANKVNTYWNDENDITNATSSKTTTIQKSNELLTEINAKVNVVEGQTVSPYFTTLQQTFLVLKAALFAQRDIKNFLDFNSNATAGETSFDTATNSVFSKSVFRNNITEGDLKVVDSNAAILAQTPKQQSTALNELLNIVNIIQSTTDFLSSGAIGSNYLGNPRDLTSAAYAYSGPLGIKSIYDRYVVNTQNWTNLITNNSYSRLQEFSNEVLEKIKILNQLSKVMWLFSAASNNVSGTDATLIEDGASFYNAFVREYNILKTEYQKFAQLPTLNLTTVEADAGSNTTAPTTPEMPAPATPTDAATTPAEMPAASAPVETPAATPQMPRQFASLFNANTDFWRLFDRSFAIIDAVHNEQKNGALDLLDDFLVNNITDRQKEGEARNVIVRVFSFNAPDKINNDSFTDLGALLLNQLSNTSVLVQVTTSIRSYFENRMEEGFRKYLGTYGGETQVRIEAAINNIFQQFGTADGSTEGRSWNVEINLALGTNPVLLARLIAAFRSLQNYIDSILALQLVVDKYVQEPTEENRTAAIEKTLWDNLNKFFEEVNVIATTRPNAIFSQGLISFASQLARLKEVQANKIRLVQGLLVATTATDITKINFEAIANPYEDEKALFGETFNLYTALGATKTDNGLITPVALDNSLLYGATRYRFSSDTLIYGLLNLVNPRSNAESITFTTDGTNSDTITLNINYPGKNSSYLPIFVEVQRAFNRYFSEELYTREKAAELEEFNKSLAPLLAKVKTLNINQNEVDNDNNSLYSNINILLPPATEASTNFNFEQRLSLLVVLLQKQQGFDAAANAFLVNPTTMTFEALQTARQELSDARSVLPESRSEQQVAAEVELNKTLDIVNAATLAFDTFKAQPTSANLALLTQRTAEFVTQTTEFEKVRDNLTASRKLFVEQVKQKATSFNVQIELIRAAITYALAPTETNKSALEEQITNIRAIPDISNEQSQEFILLSEITKIKELADKVLPLKTAYEANQFNGLLTDRLLKEALDEFELLRTQNSENTLIIALLTRVQIPLKTLEANRNIDKSLSEFTSTLTQASKDALSATIAKSKELIGEITKAEALAEQLTTSDVDAAVASLVASIPSHITTQYIQAADEAFETYKLFEQYKIAPTDALRTQILRGIDRTNLFNEAARHLSIGIDALENTSISVTSDLQALAGAYDAKYPVDNLFGNATLNRIQSLLATLTVQKGNVNTAFTTAQAGLTALLATENPNQQQIEAARKTLSDAQIELKRFNNLTTPFNNGQRIINQFIKLRIEAIQLQIQTVDFLRSYVNAKKLYADKVYEAGKQLVQTRDQIERLNILIPSLESEINTNETQLAAARALINPDASTLQSIAQLEMLITNRRETLATSRQLLETSTRNQVTLLATLQQNLDEAIPNIEVLRTQIQTSATDLLRRGEIIDAEAVRTGSTEKSRETKLATQALNTFEILEDLQPVLTNYFLHQIQFVTTDYQKVKRYSQNFAQIRLEAVTILPQELFDAISSTISTYVNDSNAYDANNNYIIDQNETNRGQFADQNRTNNTIADINNILDALSKFNNAINTLRNNLRNENIAPVNQAFTEYATLLSSLVTTSYLTNDNLTSLTSLYKNQIVQRVQQLLQAKFEILSSINTFLISPSATNSEALLAVVTRNRPLESQTAEIFKVDVLVKLAEEIKNLNTVVGLITTEAKDGLGDKVQVLILKSIANPTSVTTQELTSLKSQLIIGDKSAPLGVIKERLVAIIDKLSADSRTSALVRDLKDVGSHTSDISIRFDKNPEAFVNNDTASIRADRDAKLAIIDNAIKDQNKDVETAISAAKTEVDRILAKAEAERTEEEKVTLAENNRILEATNAAKTDLDAKKEVVAATTKELEEARTQRNTLVAKTTAALSDEETTNLNTANTNAIPLERTLREKQVARDANNAEIKILNDKKLLILNDAQKTRLATLKDNLEKTLTPGLQTAETAVTDARSEVNKVIDAKATSVLSAEEVMALNAKRATIPALEKARDDAQAALDKNRDDIKAVILANALSVLGDRGNRDYLNNISALDANQKLKDAADAKLAQVNSELNALTSKPEAELTNEEREKIVALNLDKTRAEAEVAAVNTQRAQLMLNIATAENRIVASLSAEEKSKHDILVSATPVLTNTLRTATNALNATNLEIASDERRVITEFTSEELAAYNTANATLTTAIRQRDNLKTQIANNQSETRALENIVENSLSVAEKAKLVELNGKVAGLEAEVKTAQDALNANRTIIETLTKKGQDALSEEEKATLATLNGTISTVEARLATETEAVNVALNTLTTTQNDAKKAIADDKVAAKEAQIMAKQAEIQASLLDTSTEGQAKTTQLNAELKTLQDELVPLKTAAEALNATKANIESLAAERTKVAENAEKLININNEEIRKIEEARNAGGSTTIEDVLTSITLPKVIAIIAEDNAKESTSSAIAAGVAENVARSNEALVKAIADRNELSAAREAFAASPSAENQARLIKAIQDVNTSNTALNNSDILASLPATLRDTANVVISANTSTRLENDIIGAANAAFRVSDVSNKATLNRIVADARTELANATTALEAARQLPETDATRAQKIQEATERLANATSANNTAEKFARYARTLDMLTTARDNISTEPKTTDATISAIEADLALFNDDDADPVLKLARDAARMQIGELKVAVALETLKVAADDEAKKFIANPTNAGYNAFIEALIKYTDSNTAGTTDYTTIHRALNKISTAIDVYGNSNVATAATIATATNAANEAKMEIDLALARPETTEAAKAILNAAKIRVDALLANLQQADSKQAEATKELNEAVISYTIGASSADLDNLNSKILAADNSRVDTRAIKGILKAQQDIMMLNELVARLKTNILDTATRTKLTTDLATLKTEFAQTKQLAATNPHFKTLSDIVELRLNSVEIDANIFNGRADDRALSISIDRAIMMLEAPQNKTSAADIQSLRNNVNGLSAVSETEIATRNELLRKVTRLENEVLARNAIEALPASPTLEQITALETLVNNSMGNYSNLVVGLKFNQSIRMQLDAFKQLSFDDATIAAKITELREMSTLAANNTQTLTNSPNATIKAYATKAFPIDTLTKETIQAETTLYEGINEFSQTKIEAAKAMFERIYANMAADSKEQYEKLFNSLGSWENTVKLAKTGNIRAILDIENIKDVVNGLNTVSNISTSGIISEAQKYILSDSTQWKATVGGLSASAAIAAAAASVFGFLRWRRKKKSK